MTPHYIINIIEDLNAEIYQQLEVDDMNYLTYSTDGCYDIIEFLGVVIWHSEDDLREYIDEERDIREDLEAYLRKTINKFIKNLSKIKLEET